jgi:hypothetical protein
MLVTGMIIIHYRWHFAVEILKKGLTSTAGAAYSHNGTVIDNWRCKYATRVPDLSSRLQSSVRFGDPPIVKGKARRGVVKPKELEQQDHT